MHVDSVRDTIAAATGTRPGFVEPIPGGWDFDTFRVDGEWIYRFPKRRSAARALESELRILPLLGRHVQMRIPSPEVVGTANRLPFAGYRRIPGRPLLANDRASSWIRPTVLAAIDQIHGFDVDVAARLLDIDDPRRHWTRRSRQLAARAEADVGPLLDRPSRDAMHRRMEAFIRSLGGFTPTFIHADLGPGHILVDEHSHSVGIIDFGDATVGDPAIDYVGVWIAWGRRVAEAMIGASHLAHGPDVARRVASYWWLGSVHAVLHGIDEDDHEIMAEGVKGLTERLAELDERA